MYTSYIFPSLAPMRISRVDAVGWDGFQATLSIATSFKRDTSFGERDWEWR